MATAKRQLHIKRTNMYDYHDVKKKKKKKKLIFFQIGTLFLEVFS